MDNDIETRRKWSGHWEFHEHGTLRVVGDGALGVSKSMHYETLLKKSLIVQPISAKFSQDTPVFGVKKSSKLPNNKKYARVRDVEHREASRRQGSRPTADRASQPQAASRASPHWPRGSLRPILGRHPRTQL